MHHIIIQTIKATANSNSLNPEIVFTAHLKYSNRILPIEISGQLLGSDGKVFARSHIQLFNGSSQSLSSMDGHERDLTPYYTFYSPLTEMALEHLEELRQKNAKRDISFKLKLLFKSLVSKIPTQLGGMTHATLEMEVTESVVDVTIPSSDWTHDFLPIFGKGKYIVLEIPQPHIDNDITFIGQKLNEAINSIPKMQKDLLAGEWTEVIKESRPIWELVNEGTSNELQGYLSQNGFSDDAINHFTKSISELFKFSSKFIHKVDKSKENINPNIIASKEDAYLIYSLCVNVVNLISWKIKKVRD